MKTVINNNNNNNNNNYHLNKLKLQGSKCAGYEESAHITKERENNNECTCKH